MPDPTVTRRRIVRVTERGAEGVDDALAVERPLEIRLGGQSLSVTLRTPGHDRELVLGLLASESVIETAADVASLEERPAACADQPDAVEVGLRPGFPVDWTRLERRFASTSACGLCGRAHLESLQVGLRPIASGFGVAPNALLGWPARIEREQATFRLTGGLHAAAYADARLTPRVLREDVGRHNAVDKVCGWLLDQGTPAAGVGLLWVSGRAGAEIVLKAARAGIPLLAAVGAPSSLAAELAETARMTLVGFLREGRMNVYSGAERLGL